MNWQTIYKHLQKNGFDVYSLGQHKGVCTKPYLVLRNNGSTIQLSQSTQEYEILLYYPIDQYSGFEEYINRTKFRMNDLYPAVKLTNDQKTHYLDDDVRAYMSALIYTVPIINQINRI